VYYCTYTKNNDDFPKFSPPFKTEAQARAEAQKLAKQGYWGTIERHHEAKEDYQNDYSWVIDDEREDASTMLDYF